jgi:hypothetical protein
MNEIQRSDGFSLEPISTNNLLTRLGSNSGENDERTE